MRQKIFFYFLILLLLCSSTYSLTSYSCFSNATFSDTFEYTDQYTNHGWNNFDNGICTDAQLPPKPNITGTFGISLTGCGANANYRIDKNDFSLSSYNESSFLSFDLEIRQATAGDAGVNFFTWICESDGNPCLGINFNSNRSIITNRAFPSSITTCNAGFYDYNVSANYIIMLDPNGAGGNGSYTIYKNGFLAGDCSNVNLANLDISSVDSINVHTVVASTYTNQLLDNYNLCQGVILVNTTECDFPSLFCDTFSYNDLISDHGWIDYGNIGVIDGTTYPINYTLSETTDKIMNPTHTTEPMPIRYQVDAVTAQVNSVYSPVFSSEMDLNIIDGGFAYSAGINQFSTAYSIKAVDDLNGTLSWQYLLADGSYASLCNSCSPINISGKLKINTYFKSRPQYPFNTSNPTDHIDVFLGSTKLGTISGLVDNLSSYLAYYTISKNDDWHFIVDNYYVMAGIDKNFDTTSMFFTALFVLPNTTTSTGQGSDDLYTNAQGFWGQLGLKTKASKIFAGLIIMFLTAFVLIAVSLHVKMAPSGTIISIVEVILSFILVYIGLLPVWIMILFGFFMFFVLAFYAYKNVKTSGQ